MNPLVKDLYVDYPDLITDSEWMIGIDPGHSGMIDGVYFTAPAKMYKHPDFIFYEGVYNRYISKRLGELLKEKNISHYYTTDSNYDPALSIRAIRANTFMRKYSDRKHLLISIHGNAAPEGSESATGIEVFTSPGNTASDPKASVIFRHLTKAGWKMRTGYKDGDPDKEAKFTILIRTIMPAVLVELGFYTNYEEAKKMSDPENQERFAQLLFDAINEIIENNV